MRINKIIEIDKCYEQRVRIEPKNKKRKMIIMKRYHFQKILKKNIYKNRI